MLGVRKRNRHKAKIVTKTLWPGGFPCGTPKALRRKKKKNHQRTNQRGLLATPNKNGNTKLKRHKALVAAESPEPVPRTAFSWGFAGLKKQAVMGFSSKSGQAVLSNTFLGSLLKTQKREATTTRIYLSHSSALHFF